MAFTPQYGWLFLSVCRFFVGMGVTGLYTVDIAIVQEFVPAYKRGWVTGLTTSLLPAGTLLGALAGAFLEPSRRLARPVRGGPDPGAADAADPRLGAGIAALADRQGPDGRGAQVAGLGVAGRSLRRSNCPRRVAPIQKTVWREVFKYPRSLAAACLTGISQTGTVGLSLWMTTLFVLVLKVNPNQASF